MAFFTTAYELPLDLMCIPSWLRLKRTYAAIGRLRRPGSNWRNIEMFLDECLCGAQGEYRK